MPVFPCMDPVCWSLACPWRCRQGYQSDPGLLLATAAGSCRLAGLVCRGWVPAWHRTWGRPAPAQGHGNQLFSQTQLLLKVPLKPDTQWLPRAFLPCVYRVFFFIGNCFISFVVSQLKSPI